MKTSPQSPRVGLFALLCSLVFAAPGWAQQPQFASFGRNFDNEHLSLGAGYASNTYPVGTGGVTSGYIATFDASRNMIAPASAQSYSGIVAVSPGTTAGSAISTGTAELVAAGRTRCVFDTPTVNVNDVVVPSTTTLGQCHDSGIAIANYTPYVLNGPNVGTIETAVNPADNSAMVRVHSPGMLGSGFTSAVPPTALDASGMSMGVEINPMAAPYFAKCDAVVNTSSQSITSGTDDRAAFRAALAKAQATGARIHVPDGHICRIDPPGGIITSFVQTNNQVTFQMVNKLVTGDLVTPICQGSGQMFNGVPLQVLSAGLSGTQFTANFNFPNSNGSQSEAGGHLPGGRGLWNPLPCPTGSKALGLSPALPIAFRYSNIWSHNSFIVGQGIGGLIQYGMDKTWPITSATTDASGNLTLVVGPLPAAWGPLNGGGVFVPFITGGGHSVYVGLTGTAIDDTYHNTTSVTANTPGLGQFTLVLAAPVGGAHASLSSAQGVLHVPWTNFDADGFQNQWLTGISLELLNLSNNVRCPTDPYCTYVPGTALVTDYRGGDVYGKDINFYGAEQGFLGINSDFSYFENLGAKSDNIDVYIGPNSDPFYISRLNDYASTQGVQIDGAGTQTKQIVKSHLRVGGAANSMVSVVNRNYDSSASNGGGIGSGGITLEDTNFEYGGGCSGNNTPPAFVSIDTDSLSSTGSQDITFNRPTFVNSGTGNPCNVPYLTQLGGKLYGQNTSINFLKPFTTQTFLGWNHNLSTNTPTVALESYDTYNLAIPVSVDSGTGVSKVWSPASYLIPASMEQIWADSTSIGSTVVSSADTSQVFAKSQTLTRFQMSVSTQPAGCSTFPAFSIRDTTTGTNLVSITLTGTGTYDSGVISVPSTAGDTLTPYWSTAAVGCPTNVGGVHFNLKYRPTAQ